MGSSSGLLDFRVAIRFLFAECFESQRPSHGKVGSLQGMICRTPHFRAQKNPGFSGDYREKPGF